MQCLPTKASTNTLQSSQSLSANKKIKNTSPKNSKAKISEPAKQKKSEQPALKINDKEFTFKEQEPPMSIIREARPSMEKSPYVMTLESRENKTSSSYDIRRDEITNFHAFTFDPKLIIAIESKDLYTQSKDTSSEKAVESSRSSVKDEAAPPKEIKGALSNNKDARKLGTKDFPTQNSGFDSSRSNTYRHTERKKSTKTMSAFAKQNPKGRVTEVKTIDLGGVTKAPMISSVSSGVSANLRTTRDEIETDRTFRPPREFRKSGVRSTQSSLERSKGGETLRQPSVSSSSAKLMEDQLEKKLSAVFSDRKDGGVNTFAKYKAQMEEEIPQEKDGHIRDHLGSDRRLQGKKAL